jgi:protein-histidine pros-kinase
MIDSTLEYLRNEKQSDVQLRFDISALLYSLAEDAKESGMDLTVSGQASPVLLYPLAIRRCVNNLLDNALRYGGSARVLISESAQQVVISIQDAGPGIAENKLDAVFEPFFRLEDSRNRHTGGVGLGLSIARDMAKKNGGELTLRNAAEGGLIATLCLPVRR